MAPSRRGRGFGSLGGGEIRGTLGTLLRTTLAQAGAVRDALERGAREGRARLDDARIGRRHEQALAELGTIVLDHVRSGELADLEEIREIADAIAAIEELEARQDRDGRDGRDRDEPPPPPPPSRRGRDARAITEPARRRAAPDRHDASSDGTVSSGAWAPPRPSGSARVWRPVAPPDVGPDDAEPPNRPHAREDEPGARFREDRRPRGGISFERRDETGPDPDDDLAEYMNPADVPSRDPSAKK